MKERTHQYLMSVYRQALGSTFVLRADWPQRLHGAMISSLVRRSGGTAVATYDWADRCARTFMLELGYDVGCPK